MECKQCQNVMKFLWQLSLHKYWNWYKSTIWYKNFIMKTLYQVLHLYEIVLLCQFQCASFICHVKFFITFWHQFYIDGCVNSAKCCEVFMTNVIAHISKLIQMYNMIQEVHHEKFVSTCKFVWNCTFVSNSIRIPNLSCHFFHNILASILRRWVCKECQNTWIFCYNVVIRKLIVLEHRNKLHVKLYQFYFLSLYFHNFGTLYTSCNQCHV